jgi:hypothetical protein
MAHSRSPSIEAEIRFGILCDGTELCAWQVECLEAIAHTPGCVPVVVVLNATPRPRATLAHRLGRALRSGTVGWAVFDRLVASRPSPATRGAVAPAWFYDLPRMECAVTRKGRYREYFDEADITALRAHKLDFLLKFGFGIVGGPILDAARHGVWSFHHGDEMRYRGAPPAFWEIYLRDPVTGSILQRLTERLDGGVVLRRGYFRTIADSYVRNRDQAYRSSAEWPAQVCRDILRGEDGYLNGAPSASTAPVYRYPGSRQVAMFALRIAANWVGKQFGELLFCDIWNIGVVREPLEAIARRGSIGSVRWLDAPGGDRYLADPAGIQADGTLWLMAEDYRYSAGRGVIAARALSPEGLAAGPWQTVIEEPHHLSYPHVFAHEGEFYCLPESAESGEVVLYRAQAFPQRWVRHATLLTRFAGIDPTLFRHEGRWWLFSTDLAHGDCSHLHVFHAESLTGPYTPHGNNPVKIDVRGSRPAGPLFQLDGAWIRPAQNDAATYGASIRLNRIMRLTPHAFEEEFVAELLPESRGSFACGLHTIHGVGTLTLVDGKRRRFLPRVFINRLRQKAAKLLPRQIERSASRS